MKLGIVPASAVHPDTLVKFIHELAASQGIGDTVETDADKMRRLLNHGVFWGHVAIDDSSRGKAAGMILCKYVNASSNRGRYEVEIHDLYVSDEYRGQGVAGKLLDQAFHPHCADAQYVLEVLDWNVGAIKLYESLGATPTGDIRDGAGGRWLKYAFTQLQAE